MSARKFYKDLIPHDNGIGRQVVLLGDKIIEGLDALVALFFHENEDYDDMPIEVINLVTWMGDALGIEPSERFQDAEFSDEEEELEDDDLWVEEGDDL